MPWELDVTLNSEIGLSKLHIFIFKWNPRTGFMEDLVWGYCFLRILVAIWRHGPLAHPFSRQHEKTYPPFPPFFSNSFVIYSFWLVHLPQVDSGHHRQWTYKKMLKDRTLLLSFQSTKDLSEFKITISKGLLATDFARKLRTLIYF